MHDPVPWDRSVPPCGVAGIGVSEALLCLLDEHKNVQLVLRGTEFSCN